MDDHDRLSWCASTRRGVGRERRGFTLIELLASIAIIAVLIGIVLPAVGAARRTARGFRCQMSLRSVAFDFSIFADDQLHGDRGADRAAFGPNRFSLETFQEAQYGIDEFWAWGADPSHTMPDAAGKDRMRCTEVQAPITLLKNKPCSAGAIVPPQFVSYTFNARLWRPEVNGEAVFTTLTSQILDQGDVPLVWDADGEQAMAKGTSPVFSTPALGSTGAYANDEFWFPAMRHGGSMNAAFVDGHVASSRKPLEQRWRWEYQPR